MGILKKGQLQIQETILVVFIFIIIIVVGMTLFFRFQDNSLNQEITKFKLYSLENKMLSLPDSSEFVYTEDGIKKPAVDIFKLVAFKNVENSFGYVNITVIKLYPEKNNKECNKNKVNDCGVWNVYNKIPKIVNSKIRQETPVSLYNPETKEYSIGVLSVEAYNI